MSTIRKIVAREILDSRGFPTVEVELSMDHARLPRERVVARALVPSGASTGEGEALELRDGDPGRFLGKGVLKAIRNIGEKITPVLLDQDFSDQNDLDQTLIRLDGTPNKAKLGANAILAVSMAYCRARASALEVPVWRLLATEFGSKGVTLPVPLMNILNGGKHADNGLALQEFMIVPAGFKRFSEALRAGAEVFHALKSILHGSGLTTGVGDEGGFAPVFRGEKPHEQAIQAIMRAIEKAGYRAGKEIFLALDSAASEFWDSRGSYCFEGRQLSAAQVTQVYAEWARHYPLISIEDGLAENDWDGWSCLTRELGSRIQLVGDDLFVTNPIYLRKGIEAQAGNSILIKLNQIGSVTETLQAMKIASQAGYGSIVSHRSGETEDTFIADLAVGTDCGQIKTGSASRTDRIAKYNQLLRIEEQLGNDAQFAGPSVFERFLP